MLQILKYQSQLFKYSKNQAHFSKHKYRQASGKSPKFIISLLFLSIILAVLAFTPGEILIPNSNYRGLIFDGLHFPGVFVLFLALKECISIRKSIILILIAIITVEIIQLYIGREFSYGDIFIGSMGLVAGALTQQNFNYSKSFLTLMFLAFWLGPTSFEAMLRHQAIEAFPNLDQFTKISTRHAWEPVFNGKVQSSQLTFPKENQNRFMQVEKLKNAYWGVHYLIYKKDKTIIPSSLRLCGMSNQEERLSVRLDDKRAPTYFERINIEVPFTTELECHNIELQPYIDALKSQNQEYDLQNLLNVGLFMGPDSKATQYTISEFSFR